MNRCVLIIDDEKDACLALSAYLAKRDFQVYCAHTLEEGIEKLRLLKPQNLILDNKLPDAMGWKYATLIRGLFPDLTITLLTGGDKEFMQHPSNVPFNILLKPLNLEHLEASLSAA